MPELSGRRILITGLTGSVGFPLAQRLVAEGAEVWGAARFRSARRRQRLTDAGIHCIDVDLVTADFSAVPEGIEYVLNFAVLHPPDFDTALAANAEGIGLLMAHCRDARAVLHCSSTGVYQPGSTTPYRESDPLGDNHRAAGLVTYSISKIAAEAVVRQAARLWQLPTTIARLNVPYGDDWGWPRMHAEMMLAGSPVELHTDTPNLFTPIHEDDIVGLVPALLDVASVPATVVNWAGPDTVGAEEWCVYVGEIVGAVPTFTRTDAAIPSVPVDTTLMAELVGGAKVGWREGFGRMAENLVATRRAG